jgi:predicted acyl esterase
MLTRLVVVVVGLLIWAGPAQAYSKQTGMQTMSDGVDIAYDLYLPDGTAPVTGWPGVVVMHGLGGSKDDMAAVAEAFAGAGYAALAYTARGEGTSGGDLTLAGPREIADEQAMYSFFAGLPQVSDTAIGAWGISYGGGQIWDGLAAGIPYKAVDVVATWTDLYTALWPQNISRSGIVIGLSKPVEPRSPLIQQVEDAAVKSTDPAEIEQLAAARSAYPKLPAIKTPVYMFQGRVDYAFDVTQAENGFSRIKGPKHLYVGQFGHPPSTFTTPDFTGYVIPQSIAWLDHYVNGKANGIDKTPAVTIASATGAKRTTYAALPKTKNVTVGFRGTTLGRTGPRFIGSLETFGVSILKVQVQKVTGYPRLVAVLKAGNRVISHGAIAPKKGLDTIRLANYVQYLPKGTRLTLTFGPDGGAADFAYLGFGDSGSISLGTASLQLQALTKPISGP